MGHNVYTELLGISCSNRCIKHVHGAGAEVSLFFITIGITVDQMFKVSVFASDARLFDLAFLHLLSGGLHRLQPPAAVILSALFPLGYRILLKFLVIVFLGTSVLAWVYRRDAVFSMWDLLELCQC